MSCKILQATAENLAFVADKIKQGYIVSFPTDTVFALATSSLIMKSVEKIFTIKKRSHKKSLPLLTDRVERIMPFIENQPRLQDILQQQDSYSPITYVVKTKAYIPFITNIYYKQNSIAFRMPRDHISHALLSHVKEPIVATSANISGHNNNHEVEGVINAIGQDQIDYMIVPDAGYNIALPSTILDIRQKGHIVTLREGAKL